MTGLLFHSIDEKPRLNMSSYSKRKFGQFLDYLNSNDINTITVSEHTAHPQNQQKASAVITFDDALQSFYDNAYPLLEEKKIKTTIFAIAGLVGKSGNWDVMGQTRHISAPALRKLAYRGHEIGSHSLTHANLIWLDDADLMKELRDSKTILENITGSAIKSLSFPFGSWNKRVWDAAKSAGYEYAAAYRGHHRAPPEILPVMGVYRFDSVTDIAGRMLPDKSLSSRCSRITAKIMSHFSKGTPICKFRKEYYKRFP
jgi:peptidoglycan/xylan/chitin deacetylase (PgdA/CDA1 family)